MKKAKNLELQGEIGPELKALLEEISPEELETGILKTNRKTKAKNWTAADIQNTVQTELTVRSVGKLLSLARAERGQTLAEVSQNLSVSRGRVHQREQEDANLEVRSLVEQARALGFDVIVTLKPRKTGRNIRAELQ